MTELPSHDIPAPITAHNVYRTVLQDEHHHKNIGETVQSAVSEILHSAGVAERPLAEGGENGGA